MSSTTDTFLAGNVMLRKASAEDDRHLRSILRDNAMDSWIQLTTEREPCYFDGESLMGISWTVIGYQQESHELAGMFSCGIVPVHVNGLPEIAGYLGELRIDPRFRHRIRLMKAGFRSIGLLVPEMASVSAWFTSLASENIRARRLLEARLRDMPRYQPAGEMETMVIDVRRGKNHGLLQPASSEDIDDLVEFYNRKASVYQFSPVLQPQWLRALSGDRGLRLQDFFILRKEGSVKAAFALWDQRVFRQTVCRGYRHLPGFFRVSSNLYSSCFRRIRLPDVGSRLEHLFLAFFALNDMNEALCLEIVQEALFHAQRKSVDAAVLGLSAQHPLGAYIRQKFKPVVYRSCIETVTMPDREEVVLNGLSTQPEIALL